MNHPCSPQDASLYNCLCCCLRPALANRTSIADWADACYRFWRSVEIMSHVGSETLVKLNDGCCLLEDAYMKSIKRLKDMKAKHEVLLHGAVCLRELVNNEDGLLLLSVALTALKIKDC